MKFSVVFSNAMFSQSDNLPKHFGINLLNILWECSHRDPNSLESTPFAFWMFRTTLVGMSEMRFEIRGFSTTDKPMTTRQGPSNISIWRPCNGDQYFFSRMDSLCLSLCLSLLSGRTPFAKTRDSDSVADQPPVTTDHDFAALWTHRLLHIRLCNCLGPCKALHRKFQRYSWPTLAVFSAKRGSHPID